MYKWDYLCDGIIILEYFLLRDSSTDECLQVSVPIAGYVATRKPDHYSQGSRVTECPRILCILLEYGPLQS